MNFTLSKHASLRMPQRNLSANDVEYVLINGSRIRKAGVTHYFLGKKDIPKVDRSNDEITRLEGSIILIDSQSIVTVYRDKDGCKDIRKKAKYNRKKSYYNNLPLAV